MAQKHPHPLSHPYRFPVLCLTLLLLLLAGATHATSQPAAAQTAGTPAFYAASQIASRVTTITPDPTIQGMIDQVYSDTVSIYDRQLAGELPVWVDGAWYTIPTRYTYSGTPIQKTTSFVGQHMDGLGLNVEYHQWGGSTYPNVIGELPGLTQPGRIVIIGGHIDDVQGAPGADDNGSGSVATLIAADILSQYNWGCTLRFAFWTGEEEGLLGSNVYAQRAHQRGEDIEGYLNLDMIAFNTIGSPHGIDLIYNAGMPATHDLALLYSDVVTAYNIDLIPDVYSDPTGDSDHYSFWQQGYISILGIEDFDDFNPYYHSAGDTPAHTDLVYFTDFVKASVGTFAHMGCLLPPSGNLIGTVSDADSAPIASARVQASLTPTQHWQTTTSPDGTYGLELVPGVYTVTAQAPGYMDFVTPGIMVTEDLTTTLDITLIVSPTYVLTGYVRDEQSGEPLSAVVSVVGNPITPTHSDPATGLYSISLKQGSHTLKAEHPYHHAQTQTVNLSGNQQLDFALPAVCLLVVGDDSQYGSFYTDSLDRLGTDYQYVTQSPDPSILTFYQGLVWLTGDQVTGTLTQSDQASLAAYLDGGGRLFLSGQNIGQDIGGSSFFSDYLHASYVAPDAGLYVLRGLGFLNPLVDIFIQGGHGANNQASPDIIVPANGGEAVYQYWTNPLPVPAQYGGVAFFGTHHTAYYSFGFEGINRPADRDSVMAATLNALGMCTPPQAPQAGFTSAPGAGRGVIRFTNTSQGTPLMTYSWDFGDGAPASSQANPQHAYAQPGFYTVSLTVTSRYGQDIIQAEVFIPYEVYLPMIDNQE